MSADLIIRSAVEAGPVEVDRPRRQVRALVNTEDIDRHQTLISPRGIDTRNYMRNPVLMHEHSADSKIPVGRTLALQLVRDPEFSDRYALEGLMQFRSDSKSDEVFEAYADGSQKGFSINIKADPDHVSPPTREEIAARPELARCSLIYGKGELLEISATALPSNPRALALEVRRSGLPGAEKIQPTMGIREAAHWLGVAERDIINLIHQGVLDCPNPGSYAKVFTDQIESLAKRLTQVKPVNPESAGGRSLSPEMVRHLLAVDSAHRQRIAREICTELGISCPEIGGWKRHIPQHPMARVVPVNGPFLTARRLDDGDRTEPRPPVQSAAAKAALEARGSIDYSRPSYDFSDRQIFNFSERLARGG